MSIDEKNVSWPGWEVVRLIGRGSFGTVYEIQRDVLGSTEKAALKVISIPQNASDIDEMYSNGYDEESITSTFKGHLKSIVAEYSMMRKLSDCPNIVSCDDVRYIQHDDGIGWDIYIKMELLTPLLKSFQGSVSEEAIIKLAKDICSALVVCKQHNIIHRDIKPQNIILAPSGIYKLGDFGIAKTVEKTMGGTKIGTYNYMAPEVYNNKPYGSAADIYSLGLVLYWLLNERRMPFLPLPPEKLSVGMDEAARNRRLSGEQFAEPKNGSEELKAIVMKACAYNVKDRYSSAAEMLRDLEQIGPTVSENESEKTVGIFGERKLKGTERTAAEQEDKTVGLFLGSSAHTVPGSIGVEAGEITKDNGTQALHEHDTKQETSNNTASQKSSVPSKRTLVLCGVLGAVVAVLLLALWPRHTHVWDAATCSQPKTCSECGETEGGLLDHVWSDADCVTPKTCMRCGATDGKAMGHNWSDATCTTPGTCLSCGETGGFLLDHEWLEATYQDPQTCSVCGITQGESLSAPWKQEPLETASGIISVSPGGWASYALTDQGKVYAIGRNQDGQAEVSHWSDVVDISGGDRHVVVLHEDGTVDAIGRAKHGQCNVHSWRNVIDISAGTYCTVGICEDGTVELAGQSDEVTFDVSDWTNIVQVDATDYFIVGLRVDGTVVYTGGNGHEGDDDYHETYYKYDRNGNKEEIESWEDIVAVAAGCYHTIGLRSDGTVVATTPKSGEFPAACDMSDWKDIVAISAGASFSVGLRRDGTVVVAGDFCDKDKICKWKGSIRTAEYWTDIIQIEAVYNQIIGLTKNGDIVACGFNTWGQCEAYDLQRECFGSR